jgi:YidC/Oxa1 family membrane protein insertase
MNRNTIIGLLLIFLILIGYSLWMTPSKEEKEAFNRKQDSAYSAKRIQDSIAFVRFTEQQKQDSLRKLQPAATSSDSSGTSMTAATINRDKLGVFAGSSAGTDEIFHVENDLLKIGISSKGGKIVSVELKDFRTYDSLPLILFDPQKTNFQ